MTESDVGRTPKERAQAFPLRTPRVAERPVEPWLSTVRAEDGPHAALQLAGVCDLVGDRAIRSLQGSAGNRAVQRLVRPGSAQDPRKEPVAKSTGLTGRPQGMLASPVPISYHRGVPLQRQHTTEWRDYIEGYRVKYGLAKAGPAWVKASAAAVKLDFFGDRTLNPAMALTNVPAGGGKAAYVGELDDIRAFLATHAPGAPKEHTFDWGPTNAQTFGTRMKVTLLPPAAGAPPLVGSKPTSNAGKWPDLQKRRTTANQPVFKRGHLLHDQLGGPGLDYNMVPLTGDANGDFGVNDANGGHRALAESSVLGLYKSMAGAHPGWTKIEYEVEAKYGNHGRGNPIARLLNVQQAYNKQLTAMTKKGKAPKHGKVALAMGYKPGSDEDMAIEEAVNAKPKQLSTNVDQRLKDNRTLWMNEDVWVPLQLDVSHTAWSVFGGFQAGPYKATIPNILPLSLDAYYG